MAGVKMAKELSEWVDLILRFRYRMSSLEEIDEWVYHSGDTEEVLGNGGYFDYEDYEFCKKYNRNHRDEIEQMLSNSLKKICKEDYRKCEVKWIANNILSTNKKNIEFSLLYGSGELSSLKEQGYEFIPQVFSDYYYDMSPFAEERYSKQIIEACKKLIENI